jgi:hypothetical protein
VYAVSGGPPKIMARRNKMAGLDRSPALAMLCHDLLWPASHLCGAEATAGCSTSSPDLEVVRGMQRVQRLSTLCCCCCRLKSNSQDAEILPKNCQLRRVKYLDNVIEQDHRFIKKKVGASQCFKNFYTAERTLEGIEAANMMRKGQVKRLGGSDAMGQAKFVLNLFQIAA